MANPHLEYHLQLLHHLRTILAALGEAEQVPEESHALFLERFDELLTLLPQDPLESQYLGQDLICQVIQRYPQIAHLVPRDLLWFFAGDCLHFMPDEELDLYQQLEEQRYLAEKQGEMFNWLEEKRSKRAFAAQNKAQ
ncbi:dehydrogenase [Pseudomonas sp. B21-044]|uniref:PA2817 family protein n=1 Tax=Pseudomonas sp. B21-044 TaxID=2895488 RepID=UPI00215FF2B9|nr:PA2817 family protein [Pseudomonas sp. B21-044]UVL17896.1 dehydrogenase [Pseudomonas sp. B21-044]